MFHERLKELRVKCGKKQKDLAEFLSISAQSVSKWEKGEALPSITYLPKIAQFYQCDVNAFFAETIKPSAGKKTQPMTQDEYEAFFEMAKCVLVDNQSDKELVEFLENHPAVKEEMIEIIKLFEKTNSVSISMIQRYRSCGYNKAGRILDVFETMGTITPFDGCVSRKIIQEPMQRLKSYLGIN